MQIPKLCWIKSHLPESWKKTAHFFDLPDWLTWRATGDLTRSLCSTVCKWTYKGEAGSTGQGWDKSFFDIVGLDELAYDTFKRIGTDFASPGKPLGTLTENAAECLGLTQKTCVAASMIDAHAGALGTLGVSIPGALQERMALIAGTSACHITLSEKPAHVPGIWGPYFGAVLPGLWASEAGQSMAGAAIDTILERHSAHTIATAKAAEHGTDVYSYFEQALKELAGESSIASLGEERHILPDFNGNRSPLADPTRLGVTLGQGPISHVQDLATDYLACVQSLAYGTRHILDQLANHQIMPEAIIVSGGLARNNLYCQTHADATGCLVAVPEQQEPVLLGSAMLAAVGAGWFSNLPEAMEAMSGSAQLLYPDQRSTGFHDRKYRVFRQMHDDFAAYRAIMSS